MVDWPSNAPHPTTVSYDVYRMEGDNILRLIDGRVLTEDDCAERFQQRYGQPPDYIIGPYTRHLWVGPVPERGES